MSSSSSSKRPAQGRLFAVPEPVKARSDAAERARRGPRRNRAERMAARLDGAARAAEREVAACRRAGDEMRLRKALDELQGARRAAAMLRGGPDSVESLLDAS